MKNSDQGGRRAGQRFKSLLIWNILLKQTDEQHPLSAKKIRNILLDDYNIEAEEHSIGRDIKELQRLYAADKEEAYDEGERFSYKIEYDGSGERGYKITKRPCKFSDLQLLAECIHSSAFISEAQERRLIKSLGEYCSQYQETELQVEPYLIDRNKTKNDKLLRYIQTVNRSIKNAHQIQFQYMKYTLRNGIEQTPRFKGRLYVVSPFKLLINEGNFYLLAYDGKKIATYRLDRMNNVIELQTARNGIKDFESMDMRTYAKRVFSMFGGEEKKVTIRFNNKLLDTVVDRFGVEDVFYSPIDDHHFTLTANIEVSDQFYSWICRFRKQAVIVSPSDVVDDFRDYLQDILQKHENSEI